MIARASVDFAGRIACASTIGRTKIWRRMGFPPYREQYNARIGGLHIVPFMNYGANHVTLRRDVAR